MNTPQKSKSEFDVFQQIWIPAHTAGPHQWTADIWSEDASFLPFDGSVALKGRRQATDWIARRRALGALRVEVSELCTWRFGATLVVAASQDVFHRAGEAWLRRSMTLLAAVALEPRPRLRHVSEATPAFLPLVIATYRAEAQRLFPS